MIAFRAAAATTITAGATSSSVPIPAGTAAGDLLISWCEIGQVVTNFSGPAGWTQFSWSPAVDGANSNAFAFWKIAVNGESAGAISWTGSSKGVLVTVGYSSVDNVNPIGNTNVNIETSSQTTATTPSLAAVANEWAVTIHSSRTSTTGNKAPTWAPAPTGETQRNSTDNSAAAAAPWNAVVAYDSNGAVTVASHSYTATSNFAESHHKSALIYINNVAPLIAESAPAVDTVARAVALPRAIAESAPAVDTVVRVLAVTRAIAELAPAVDTVVRSLALPRSLAESAPAVDATARTLVLTRPIPESAPAVDTTVGTVALPRNVAESALATDSATAISALPRSVAELAPAGDAVSRALALPRTAAESAQATDAATAGSLVFARAISESAPAVDSTATTTTFTRAIAESAPATDVATAHVHTPRNLSFHVGLPALAWIVGEPVISWDIGQPVLPWIVGRPTVPSLSALATMLVEVPVTDLSSGLPVSPTGDAVSMAFMLGRAQPGDSDWKTGSWGTSSVNGQYFARCLVGPTGGETTLTPGVYTIWVKIEDDPETPIAQSGTLIVY